MFIMNRRNRKFDFSQAPLRKIKNYFRDSPHPHRISSNFELGYEYRRLLIFHLREKLIRRDL